MERILESSTLITINYINIINNKLNFKFKSENREEKETILTLFKSFFKYPNLAVIFFTMIFNW